MTKSREKWTIPKSKTIKEPIYDGAKAAESHVDRHENPYPKGTKQHNDWDYQWCEQTWGGIEY